MVITWQQLRDAREYADLTQTELAAQIGVSTRTIVNWEAEGSSVPRKSEYKVERVLAKAMRNVEQLKSQDYGEPEEPRFFVPTSDGQQHEVSGEEYDRYLDGQRPSLETNGIPDPETNARARRRGALGPFTDMDLVMELEDRTRDRGISSSDWSATGLGKLHSIVPAVRGGLHTVHIDEERHAADTKNQGPDEDLRQP